MEKYRCLFDTDVLINWLVKEGDLWKAPMDPATQPNVIIVLLFLFFSFLGMPYNSPMSNKFLRGDKSM